jgi:uncharacterized protein YuzE
LAGAQLWMVGISVRAPYDSIADAAYVYLVGAIAPGGVARTALARVGLNMASIAFDFDSGGSMLGVEIVGASRVLADEALTEPASLTVRVSCDEAADAAYVAFVDELRPGDVQRTVPADLVGIGGGIDLDFDADSRLLGIGILDAKRLLTPDVLRGLSGRG